MTKSNSFSSRSAFSYKELLVAIAIVGVLSAVTYAAVIYLRESSRKAQCSNNLRLIGASLLTYAQENHGLLPNNSNRGLWAWDTSYDLIQRFGPHDSLMQISYCPSGAYKGMDVFWDPKSGLNGFRPIGYVMMLSGTHGLSIQNLCFSTDPNMTLTMGSGETIKFGPSVERPLAVDATLSLGYKDFSGIAGDAPEPHRANHMMWGKPTGGNIVFLDGHVGWRPFKEMKPRVNITGLPWFWW